MEWKNLYTDWEELDHEWKVIFELSLKSYCEGNLPIAAIITDYEGNILSSGRNHLYDSERFPNPRVKHAETECIQQLDVRKYTNLRDYTLYTSLEPCPMCMGTIIMGNIKKVRVAAKDGWAGATDLCDKSAYMRGKKTDIQFINHIYTDVSMTLLCYAEMRRRSIDNPVILQYKSDYPEAFEAAIELYEGNMLVQEVIDKKTVEEVYHLILSQVQMTARSASEIEF